MELTEYSEKSFVVFGDTKPYKDSLKALGGKFNSKLKIEGEETPGWIFSKKQSEKVQKFLAQVAAGGEAETNSLPSLEGEDGSETFSSVSSNPKSLPKVVMVEDDNKYQFVKFKIFKPRVGMTVTVKSGKSESVGEVSRVETHNDIVDTAYIKINDGTSLAVICRQTWQIFGYTPSHKVFFSN